MTDHLKMIKDPSSFQIAVIIRTKIIHSSYLRMNLILHHLWIIFSPHQTPSNSIKHHRQQSVGTDALDAMYANSSRIKAGCVNLDGRPQLYRCWSVSLTIFLVSKVCPTIASFNWCEQQLAMLMTIIVDLSPVSTCLATWMTITLWLFNVAMGNHH